MLEVKIGVLRGEVMNVFGFISKSDYAEIKQAVEKQEPFEYEKTKGKISFRLHNFYASTNWNEETKEGDYLVSIGYDYQTGGCGSPVSRDKFLQRFETYETATKYIDKFIGRLEEYGYETLENTVEQTTLF